MLAYFPTVARNPVIDQTRIHLIDAFCGGGVFRDPEQGHTVLGSPLVMASAVSEALHNGRSLTRSTQLIISQISVVMLRHVWRTR